MLHDPAFLAAAAVGLIIAGVSKAGFGSGAAFAATPILALTAPPQVAVAILLPVLMLMDAIGVWAYRWRWSGPHVAALIKGSVIGVAIGAALISYVSEPALKLSLGLIALFFVLWRAAALQRAAPSAPRWWSGWVFGGCAGFTSMIAHAGGPLVAMHLLPQKLPKTTFQATTVAVFATLNFVKLPFFIGLGLFTSETLFTSLVLAPLAVLGSLLGLWAHKQVSERLYYRVIYTFLSVVGVKLIYDGAAELL